ncbi:aliphatic sulfonate ABC transporter substrate-binding protein [Xylanibacillus composti]|uniref:Putative aliphatic sulfonates-binding protein n=1 Tax=Xylanibacillus composti TaxID=1572762 RepID=A0A8J4H4U4_9BACL|nr:aliphatic sulfonate ABC transporter substrate-binding protein [Xylanibacillus composti]GIQ69537.1 hypothetical protein XYCOK13_23610 [Xylanibacillus composti]
MLEALNVGSIDIAHTGETPPIFAQAAGAPLVYLAHEPPSPAGEAIVVRKESDIETVAALKGKKVALNKGSNVHYLLVKKLEEAGLQYEDIETAYLPPADARIAFEKGDVDAWVIWDPYLAAVEDAIDARILADGEGSVKNYEFYLASRSFAEQHPEAVNILLKELDKADQWAAEHQEELVEVLAREIGMDAAPVALASGRRGYGVQLVNDQVIAEQQAIADTFYDLQLIPEKIDLKDAVLSE